MGEVRKVLPRSGSLQVTIPRRWCRHMGLTKGSFVELTFRWETATVEVKALKEVVRETTPVISKLNPRTRALGSAQTDD